MSDLKRVHLQSQKHTFVPLRHSHYAQRRATQLHSFIAELHSTANTNLQQQRHIDLLVLNRQDWHKLFRSPYGLSFTKQLTKLRPAQLVTPADYPERLVHQFDRLFLDLDFKPPGELRECLDLLLGFDWATAYLRNPSSKKEPHELLKQIGTLYYLALASSDWQSIIERLDMWLLPKDKILHSKDLQSKEWTLNETADQSIFQAPKSQKYIRTKYLTYSHIWHNINKEITWTNLEQEF